MPSPSPLPDNAYAIKKPAEETSRYAFASLKKTACAENPHARAGQARETERPATPGVADFIFRSVIMT